MPLASFGYTADGRHVQKITLRSEQLTVSILTLGAVINDVRLSGVAWPSYPRQPGCGEL
jgi:aldose 1-epimerase